MSGSAPCKVQDTAVYFPAWGRTLPVVNYRRSPIVRSLCATNVYYEHQLFSYHHLQSNKQDTTLMYHLIGALRGSDKSPSPIAPPDLSSIWWRCARVPNSLTQLPHQEWSASSPSSTRSRSPPSSPTAAVSNHGWQCLFPRPNAGQVLSLCLAQSWKPSLTRMNSGHCCRIAVGLDLLANLFMIGLFSN